MHDDKKQRLLIVTQRVDKKDPILGFFHAWIREFAKHYESVTVIALMGDDSGLPSNVKVCSLRIADEKDQKTGEYMRLSKRRQVFKFREILQQEDYDVALVHMTPIWVVLGIGLWKKPVYLWYEARGAKWPLKVALYIVKKVFSASQAGMPISSKKILVKKKSIITGHGINTELFKPSINQRDQNLVMTAGRITAAKRLPVIIDCFEKMPKDMKLKILGTTAVSTDQAQESDLKKLIMNKNLSDRIEIYSTDQQTVATLLGTANIFLHASVTGLDKVLLEAMSAGCIVVSSAPRAIEDLLPSECIATKDTMAEKVNKILEMPPEQREVLRSKLREIIVKQHSLPRLIDLLVSEMKS